MNKNDSIFLPVIITAIRQEVPGVKTFILEREDKQQLSYSAGQFLTFVFNRYGKEERRSFSFSSSPFTDKQTFITLKRIENGAYSRYLIDNVSPEEKLMTAGVGGLFTLPIDITAYKQLFFFAAGIGITPIFSLIKTALYSWPHIPVVLVYSNRSVHETVFRQELDALVSEFSQFKLIYLYSTSYNLSRARLNKSLLPELVKEHGSTTRESMLFYVCGPFAYMRMVIFSLEELGIHRDNIRKENFDTSMPLKKVVPPDVLPHYISLQFNGKKYDILNTYPDTILQSAINNGINLPYSCKAGRCGSCAALCTKGDVWLSYNEVLTDRDILAGKVLTCVGHPVGGDIDLEI